jgi:hypothetical protein
MSILDLQALHFQEVSKAPAGSRASKQCTVNGGGGGGGEANSTLSIACEVLSP